MEIKSIILSLFFLFVLTGCASNGISNVYIEDFVTSEPKSCRPSDIDLSNDEAAQFFQLARNVDFSEIHDHYNYAPCYIEGWLKLNGHLCDWKIRAGFTGSISCDGREKYYVCENCEDIFLGN